MWACHRSCYKNNFQQAIGMYVLPRFNNKTVMFIDGMLEGWDDGRMEGKKDGKKDGIKDGRMGGWKDGWMEARKDGRMEG